MNCPNLVGLPETEVMEARDRVRAALQNAQFEFPARKITACPKNRTIILHPETLRSDSHLSDTSPAVLCAVDLTWRCETAAMP